MQSGMWKQLLLVTLLGLFVTEAVQAEEIRFATPIPSTLRTKNNTRIEGVLEGLSPKSVLFRSSRGRQMKLSNYQVLYVFTNDRSLRYYPSRGNYKSILKKAKALNAQLKTQAAQQPALPAGNAGTVPGNTGTIPGSNFGGMPGGAEPPPSNDPGSSGLPPGMTTPPGMLPGSGFPTSPGVPSGIPGSRFGRSGRTGRVPTFPGNRSGIPSGMPPGGMPFSGGMPPGALPQGNSPGFPSSNPNGLPEGMNNPNSGMPPGSNFPGSSYPGSGYQPPSLAVPPRDFSQPPIEPIMPSTDYPSPNIPSMEYTTQKQCSNCNGIVPSNLTSGDKCPHCGIRFSYDTSKGDWFTNRTIGSGIFGGLMLIGLVVFVVQKLST